MAFVLIKNKIVIAEYPCLQTELPSVIEMANDDARYLAFVAKFDIKQQISALEASITERRIREATLSAAKTASSRTADDIAALAWMTDINAQIAALRVQL